MCYLFLKMTRDIDKFIEGNSQTTWYSFFKTGTAYLFVSSIKLHRFPEINQIPGSSADFCYDLDNAFAVSRHRHLLVSVSNANGKLDKFERLQPVWVALASQKHGIPMSHLCGENRIPSFSNTVRTLILPLIPTVLKYFSCKRI